MTEFFIAIFYQPLYNLLILLLNWTPYHDIGVAIILITIIIRLLLFPLTKKSIEAQKKLQDIQPLITELKKKYKDDKEAMAKEMMRIYKENKINPMSSCLPILIQLPFLFAIYKVFRDGLSSSDFSLVYSFISVPESISHISFGFLNLANANIPLAILAGIAQYYSAKMLMSKKPAVNTDGARDEKVAAMMNKQMLYFMPAITVFIGITLPGGLTLYWLVNTLLMIWQQHRVFQKIDTSMNEASPL